MCDVLSKYIWNKYSFQSNWLIHSLSTSHCITHRLSCQTRDKLKITHLSSVSSTKICNSFAIYCWLSWLYDISWHCSLSVAFVLESSLGKCGNQMTWLQRANAAYWPVVRTAILLHNQPLRKTAAGADCFDNAPTRCRSGSVGQTHVCFRATTTTSPVGTLPQCVSRAWSAGTGAGAGAALKIWHSRGSSNDSHAWPIDNCSMRVCVYERTHTRP